MRNINISKSISRPISSKISNSVSAIPSISRATQDPWDIFFIIGQSNAIGTNSGSLVPGRDDVVDPLVKTLNFDATTISPGINPLHHQQYRVDPGLFVNSVGFIVQCARLHAAATGNTVLLVPAAYGGSSIGNWLPSGANAPDYMTPALAKLQDAFDLAPPNSKLRLVAWHQGEGDQGNSASTYATRLNTLVEYFRTNYPTSCFVCGELRRGWLNSVNGELAATIVVKTSDSIVNISLPSGHGITTSDTVVVQWDGGERTAVAVAQSTATALTLGSAGTGTAFPVAGTALVVRKTYTNNATLINDKLIQMPGVAGNYKTAFWYGNSGSDADIHYTGNEHYANGTSVYSAYQLALNNVASVAPTQVAGLTAITIGALSFRIGWSHPSCRVTKFQVKYRAQGSGSWTTIDTNSRDCFYYLRTVTGNTIYEVQVFATNETSSGPVSDTLLVYVTVPNAPTGLATGTPTTSQVPLSWTAPASGANVTSYTVQYKLTSEPTTWTTFSSSVSGTSTTISGLSHTTSYDFRVAANNPSGTGTYSSTVTTTTAVGITQVWETTTAESTLGFASSNRTCIGWTSGSNGFRSCKGAVSKSTGKWYFEMKMLVLQGSSGSFFIGICKPASWTSPRATLGQFVGSHLAGAAFYGGTVSTFAAGGFTLVNELTGLFTGRAANDIYMFAFDASVGKAWGGRNGTWFGSGNPAAGTNPWVTWTPGIAIAPALTDQYGGANSPQMTLPATQVHTIPSGFSSLNG